MSQSDRPAPRDRKARTESRSRRGGDRRPYPTAPARATSRPASPRRRAARTRSRGSATTTTPATVWACGATPTDPDAAWPTAIVETIVTSFSKPGARVVLVPWPVFAPRPKHRSAEMLDHDPGPECEDGLAAALTTVEGIGRTAGVVRIEPDAGNAGRVPRPFGADLVGDRDGRASSGVASPIRDPGSGVHERIVGARANTDLIIASVRPVDSGDHSSDLVTRFAARLLPVGGTLVVLTHSNWSGGELADPTGAVVTAAQNADLLYLQHIVALHAPIQDGHIVSELDPVAAAEQARSQHRAVVRGLPAPHRRVHSDILAFAQPHDHQPLLTPAESAFEMGVIP